MCIRDSLWTLHSIGFFPWVSSKLFNTGVANQTTQVQTIPVQSIRDRAITGDPASMRQLGVIYAYGLGVIPDAKEADFWLTRAEKKGVRLLPRKHLVTSTKPRSGPR